MSDAIVHKADDFYPEEVLKDQDGKKVPLRSSLGGPIIGEATLKYDDEEKALKADFHIDDPNVVAFLRGPDPSVIFRNP